MPLELPVTTEPLSDEVRRFVLTSIPSVPYLEALLLLRAEPERDWDAYTVARRLYVTENKAAELLRELQDAGLALRHPESGGYRYEPRDAGLREMIDKIERLYATRLVEVTALIHTRVDRRAVQFADAFRFKKEG